MKNSKLINYSMNVCWNGQGIITVFKINYLFNEQRVLKWPRYSWQHKSNVILSSPVSKMWHQHTLLLPNSKNPMKGVGLGLRFRIEFVYFFGLLGSQDREDWLEPGSKPHKNIPLDMGLDILQILLMSSLLVPWPKWVVGNPMQHATIWWRQSPRCCVYY
jgi:hypothetical protein